MRYVRLLGTQLRRSLVLGMQYRFDFVTSGVVSLLWSAISIVPLYVAFHGRPAVGGWTYESALVVFGWFALLCDTGSTGRRLVRVRGL